MTPEHYARQKHLAILSGAIILAVGIGLIFSALAMYGAVR